jgi:hypothetical protein
MFYSDTLVICYGKFYENYTAYNRTYETILFTTLPKSVHFYWLLEYGILVTTDIRLKASQICSSPLAIPY